MACCLELSAVNAVGVEDRASLGSDVDDFTFLGIEGHLPVNLPGGETIKIFLELA